MGAVIIGLAIIMGFIIHSRIIKQIYSVSKEKWKPAPPNILIPVIIAALFCIWGLNWIIDNYNLFDEWNTFDKINEAFDYALQVQSYSSNTFRQTSVFLTLLPFLIVSLISLVFIERRKRIGLIIFVLAQVLPFLISIFIAGQWIEGTVIFVIGMTLSIIFLVQYKLFK